MKGRLTVMLKSSKIRNELEFFELLFPRAKQHANIAYELFKLAKNGRLFKNSYLNVPKELNIRVPTYYSVLSKLRSLGVLKKVEDKIVPSKTFLYNLKELYDYYRSLLESEVIIDEEE